ncbi:MAG: hypothetical protein PHE56_14690, partial [Bacteroidales bacterium]|nr:hypothetical protein [Bacteroidales bacterium]
KVLATKTQKRKRYTKISKLFVSGPSTSLRNRGRYVGPSTPTGCYTGLLRNRGRWVIAKKCFFVGLSGKKVLATKTQKRKRYTKISKLFVIGGRYVG